MIKKPYKIVVFDLDETLGYFTEFGIFCDCLNYYFKNNEYSEKNFNELLNLTAVSSYHARVSSAEGNPYADFNNISTFSDVSKFTVSVIYYNII